MNASRNGPTGAWRARLWLLAAAVAAVAAVVLLAAPRGSGAGATLASVTATPSASFTAVDYAWTTDGNPDTNGSTVTIQAGQTVAFSYPSGSSVHNADFNNPNTNQPPAAPPVCARTDTTDSGANPPLPHSPEPPGWSGTCTFDTPGTYNFHCDAHPFMTGTIVVVATTTSTSSSASSTQSSSSQSSTATTTTSAATTTTTTSVTSSTSSGYGVTGNPSTTTSASTTSSGAAKAAPAFARISVSAHQRGGTVRGSVSIVGSHLRLSVTLHAKRAAIAPARSSSASVTVARLSSQPVGPGTVRFALKVAAKPATGRKLSLVMVLQLSAAKGRPVTADRDVTLTVG